MADNTFPPFPSDTTTLTTLPVGPLPFPQMTARGPDGLRAAYIFFPEMIVEARADQDYQPISAVTVMDCKVPTVPGGLNVGVDAMDRISWWLMDVQYVNDSAGPSGAPPDFDYEVRGAIGRRANRIADGTSALTQYGNNGLLLQVSGLLVTEFEFWARINPFQVGVTVGTKIKIRLGAVVDRNAGSLVIFQESIIGNVPEGVIAVFKGELGNG